MPHHTPSSELHNHQCVGCNCPLWRKRLVTHGIREQLLPFRAHFIKRSRSIKQIQQENSPNTSICRWFGDTSPLDPVVPLYWICFLAKMQFRCPDFSCQELGTRSALPATCTAECCSRCEFFTCILAGSMGGSDWMGGLHGWKVPWFAPHKYERWYLYSLKGLATSNDVFFGGDDSSGRLDLHFAKRLLKGMSNTTCWHQAMAVQTLDIKREGKWWGCAWYERSWHR